MKEKFKKLSLKLDEYIKTKRFRYLKTLTVVLGFTVTGCVCFLAGFFLNRTENMIYRDNINAITEKTEAEKTETAEKEPEVTEPPVTTAETTQTTKKKTVVDSSVLSQRLAEDIIVPDYEYSYSNTALFENREVLNDLKLPLTKKSFNISYDGVITAGLDSSLISAKADNEAHIITVIIPEAQIISHEIKQSSFKLTNVKDNILNPISEDDYTYICSQQNEQMEEKALNDGILDEVYKNAEQIISEYLSLDGIISSQYSIDIIISKSHNF